MSKTFYYSWDVENLPLTFWAMLKHNNNNYYFFLCQIFKRTVPIVYRHVVAYLLELFIMHTYQVNMVSSIRVSL